MTAKIICTATVSALLSLSLMAEEKLKLELIAPENPVVISSDQLQKAAAEVEDIDAPDSEASEDSEDVPSADKKAELIQRLVKNSQKQTPALQQGIVLTYRITNLSNHEIVLEHGGDAVVNFLEIKGPGAVNVPFQGMMNLAFAIGTPYTLKPGMSKDFVINELAYGTRDKSRWLITKEGDYEVTLTHKIVGTQGEDLELKSNTVKFSVVTK